MKIMKKKQDKAKQKQKWLKKNSDLTFCMLYCIFMAFVFKTWLYLLYALSTTSQRDPQFHFDVILAHIFIVVHDHIQAPIFLWNTN